MDIPGAAQRSALRDGFLTGAGRDPGAVTRSIALSVSTTSPHTRDVISGALDAGFRHLTVGLPAAPCPASVARWGADEIIARYR